jgi:hypothetical protein
MEEPPYDDPDDSYRERSEDFSIKKLFSDL